MRKFACSVLLLMLGGCSSIEVAPGKVYRVMEGYSATRSAYIPGKEFVFSLVPPQGRWAYVRNHPWTRLNTGRVEFVSEAGRTIAFAWSWQSALEVKSDLQGSPYLAPWLNGPDPDMRRIPYVPTERQLKSGDWDQPGYSQEQWRHFRYFGKKPYYCLSTLYKRREGLIQWGDAKRDPYNGFDYYIACPFQLSDGRHAKFIFRTGFSLTDEQIRNDPARADRNVEMIDSLLEPSWDSLQVMPGAYQFAPPVADVAPAADR